MSEITVTKERLLDVLEVCMERGAIGAGAKVSECVDDIMERLAMNNHERLLDEARYVAATDEEKSVHRQIAAAYIAMCREPAKTDPEIDRLRVNLAVYADTTPITEEWATTMRSERVILRPSVVKTDFWWIEITDYHKGKPFTGISGFVQKRGQVQHIIAAMQPQKEGE